VLCTACKTFNISSIQFTLTQGQCHSNQTFFETLTGTASSFSLGNWSSTQVATNPTSTCGYYQLLGGISIGIANSQFSYSIGNLPVHNNVQLSFNLLLIDQNPDTYQYTLSLDGVVRTISFVIQGTANYECGGTQREFLRQESLSFVHNGSSATVVISVQKSYMGIRDFLLIVDNPTADPNCLSFNNGSCQSCRNSLTLQNGTCSACISGYYLVSPNSTNRSCQPCPETCSACALSRQQVVCTACREPLTLDGTFCVDSNKALHAAEVIPNVSLSTQTIAWTYYPSLPNRGIAQCNSTEFLGSSTIQFKFLTMRRQYTGLPSHAGVVLYFTLFQIDGDYLPNGTLAFDLNGRHYTVDNITNITQLSALRVSLCGNSTLDSQFVVQLKDTSHTATTLDFAVHLSTAGKIGISNIQLYLLGATANNDSPFQLDIEPAYSVSTPARKGLQVKLAFANQFVSSVDTATAFVFEIVLAAGAGRLLSEGYSNQLVPINHTLNNQEIYYLLNLTQDYDSSYELRVRASQQSSLYFVGAGGEYQLLSQQPVTTPITRYLDVSEQDINDRSSLRNLFNLFRGCAILALFIGLASFIVGMSSAFDDFFILCQLIFVHVFIQMDYNPPSIRIPFAGLHIVQFLEWLPSAARVAIEEAILPATLYQPCDLTFQQYYQDVTFARTIYFTILYFALLMALWLLVHIFLLIYDSKHPQEQTKYSNFLVYYYKQYNMKILVCVDKMVRFAYFTICWACFLQFLFFDNQPDSFHIWNSILTVVMFAAVVLYPIVLFVILRKHSNSLSVATFGLSFEELRISHERLYYFLVRYYKLLLIALIVAVTYSSSPAIPLVLLIILNIVDAILLIALKPLGMSQPELIDAVFFYPHYPTVYAVTCIIQNILFVLMEIFFLILLGTRDSASSAAYMGIGYVICVIVILLLLNGLVRLLWGCIKILQHCYLEREANYMSVEKEVL
jgi:hypothetical protein